MASFGDSAYDNNKENLYSKVKGKFGPSLYHNVADVLSSQEELRIIFNGVVYRDSYLLLINDFC